MTAEWITASTDWLRVPFPFEVIRASIGDLFSEEADRRAGTREPDRADFGRGETSRVSRATAHEVAAKREVAGAGGPQTLPPERRLPGTRGGDPIRLGSGDFVHLWVAPARDGTDTCWLRGEYSSGHSTIRPAGAARLAEIYTALVVERAPRLLAADTASRERAARRGPRVRTADPAPPRSTPPPDEAGPLMAAVRGPVGFGYGLRGLSALAASRLAAIVESPAAQRYSGRRLARDAEALRSAYGVDALILGVEREHLQKRTAVVGAERINGPGRLFERERAALLARAERSAVRLNLSVTVAARAGERPTTTFQRAL